MKPFSELSPSTLGAIEIIFTDIDDTLTTHGQLSSACLAAMEALRAARVKVVPVTGRPAGWCHGLVRLWPVAGVIAENGAAAYWLEGRVQRELFWECDASARAMQRERLQRIQREALAAFPGLTAAQDQFMRIGDIAFDLAENVSPIPAAQIAALLTFLKSKGLTTAASSIHAHGYFGQRNKRTMTEAFVNGVWGTTLDALQSRALFIGDSGNDAPMFECFPLSVGVANVVHALGRIATPPKYVTREAECEGFIEMTRAVLAAKTVGSL